MAISRERFDQGMTYDEYKAQMTQSREQLEANERELQIEPADLAAFQGLPRPLNVLAIAEDWCGDVIANMPVLGRLAAESGKLNVRVFLRDRNLDLMDQYLKEGKYRSIPTFVFFDDAFSQLGTFSERPDSVTRLRQQKREEMYRQHPEFGDPSTPVAQLADDVRVKLQAAMATMREETRATANAEVIRELRQIVEKAGK
jgi:hypothetical protein